MATTRKIQAERLSFVHYQHPDLTRAGEFLEDFGLVLAHEDVQLSRRYYAGYGRDLYCYIAEQSPDSKRRFIGATWTVRSKEDLEIAAAHPQGSEISKNEGPGGGEKVTITDPNGFHVHFIYGQETKEPQNNLITREMSEEISTLNLAYKKPRQGNFRRFDQGPSPVHKAGHYGFIVPRDRFKMTFEFYSTIMNLKLTDAVFDPESGNDNTCFLHLDLGPEYADHHSFFLGASTDGKPAHIHHTSFEINDFDTQALGHNWLERKGWKNCWGIGRHVLGSQIFDYWFDASGNILEHYSDGDLVNEDTEVSRNPECPESLYIWGPNIPLAFITGNVKDVIDPPTPPVLAAA